MNKYSYNENYFKKIDTPEKAYWLGFLYADGCIIRFYRNKKLKSMSLELTLQSSDKEHLEKFRRCLNSNVPIYEKKIKKYFANKIVFNCTSMCRDLINNGCTPKKSYTLSFPNDGILKKDLISHFIRGYFDGDGGVYYNESNTYDKYRKKYYLQYHYSCYFCGNNIFLNSIKMILEEEGIRISKIYKDKRSNNYQLFIYGKENIKLFKEYIYKNQTINLSRKFNKFCFVQNCKDLKINK